MLGQLFLAVSLAAAEPCLPAPPAADHPPPASSACAAGEAPTAERVNPGRGSESCRKVHARALSAAAAEWAAELHPKTGKLFGPLTERPLEERVSSLWNQDSAGKAACVRSPHLELCDPERRGRWLARLIEEDDRAVAKAKELFAWYVQAHAACMVLAKGWTADAAGQLASHRKRLQAGYRAWFPSKADESPEASRLRELNRHHGSSALEVSAMKEWSPAVDAWAKSLGSKPKAPKAKGPKRPKPPVAETAPPAD